jgi:hypothetical protein
MADQHDVIPLLDKRWTSRCTLVTSGQVASIRRKPASLRLEDVGCNAVGARMATAPARHFAQLLDEDGPFSQPADDVAVVNDLAADIDRRAEDLSARSTIFTAIDAAQKPRGLARTTFIFRLAFPWLPRQYSAPECGRVRMNADFECGIIVAIPVAGPVRLKKRP